MGLHPNNGEWSCNPIAYEWTTCSHTFQNQQNQRTDFVKVIAHLSSLIDKRKQSSWVSLYFTPFKTENFIASQKRIGERDFLTHLPARRSP